MTEHTPAGPTLATGQLCMAETDDAYAHIVAKLSENHRLIECSDGLQWIVQRRRPSGRWLSLGYFRTRDGLFAHLARLLGADLAKVAGDILADLPERYREGTY